MAKSPNSALRNALAPKPAPAPAPEPQADIWTPRTTTSKQPSRDGMLAITVHYPPEVRRQLKTLAAEQDRTMDDMVAEALNLLFVRYQKAEITPRKAVK